MSSCRFFTPSRKNKTKWCAAFSTALLAPFTYTYTALNRVQTKSYAIASKAMALAKEGIIVLENVHFGIALDKDRPDDILDVQVNATMPVDSILKNSQFPPQLSEIPKELENIITPEAWFVTGIITAALVGVVTYQWYHSKPNTSSASNETSLDDIETAPSYQLRR